jgi:hypothetical protein
LARITIVTRLFMTGDSPLSHLKCSKISINIERDFDYIRDAKYLEYDVYKLSEIILSFRLYFDSDVIRLPCLNKVYVYSIYTTEGEIKEIADNIISLLNIIE